MISFKKLYEGLVSGEITIDENGHDPFYGWDPESMLDSMKHKIDFWDNQSSLAKKGFIWSDHIVTEHGRDTDRHITGIEKDSPCSRCGKHVKWIYVHEENKIKCIEADLISDGLIKDWHYVYNEQRCTEEVDVPQSFEFDVKGEIVFANFFRDHMNKLDVEEKERKYDYFSLCNTAGRKRVCEFHAKDNIGFQQMTNTSVDLYLSKDKTEILVIEESYVFDPNTINEEGEAGTEFSADDILPKLGYKHCGHVSCDMWRYMFGNVSDVKDIGGGSVKLKSKKGKYKVTNYFATSEHDTKIDRFPIASRIKLIQ
jgi:predicted HicB family RNase H-like nuclease